jgi:hypothetical protein
VDRFYRVHPVLVDGEDVCRDRAFLLPSLVDYSALDTRNGNYYVLINHEGFTNIASYASYTVLWNFEVCSFSAFTYLLA